MYEQKIADLVKNLRDYRSLLDATIRQLCAKADIVCIEFQL